MKKLFLFLMPLLFFSGCVMIRASYVRKHGPDFGLRKIPFVLPDSALLNVNATYVCKTLAQGKTRFSFYRFYPDGRVLCCALLEKDSLTATDINENVSMWAQISYYRVQGNKMQIDDIDPVGLHYFKKNLQLCGDSIKEVSFRYKGIYWLSLGLKKYNTPSVYVKTKVY